MLCILVTVSSTQALEQPCEANGRLTGESASYVASMSPTLTPLTTGQFFGLGIIVCQREGAPYENGLRVSARMPAHGHGMNYTPTVTRNGLGKFSAEGLLFHMVGNWEFVIDLEVGETITIEQKIQ